MCLTQVLTLVVPSVAAALGVWIGVLIAWRQLSQAKQAVRADVIVRLDGQFSQMEKDGTREAAARAIWDRKEPKLVEPVLDFFEGVGILLKRGLIDEQLASDFFAYWILRYAAFTLEHVEQRRKELGDPTYWEHFRDLTARMKRMNPREGSYSDSERREFLKEEGVTDAELGQS